MGGRPRRASTSRSSSAAGIMSLMRWLKLSHDWFGEVSSGSASSPIASRCSDAAACAGCAGCTCRGYRLAISAGFGVKALSSCCVGRFSFSSGFSSAGFSSGFSSDFSSAGFSSDFSSAGFSSDFSSGFSSSGFSSCLKPKRERMDYRERKRKGTTFGFFAMGRLTYLAASSLQKSMRSLS